jgi:alkylated DNA repair dioxygenase AlkB
MAHEDIQFLPGWLAAAEADALFARLLEHLPLKQESIVLFGRTVSQPRLTLWMGDPDAVYRYSGRTFVPFPWDADVLALRERVESVAGERFNSVLANLYRSGLDTMGYHSDDEPELGAEPVIASLSFGATRRFVLRPRRRKGSIPAREFPLGHCSLLVMRGNTQREWVHGVPRERIVTEPRLNLTFRRVLSGALA